MEVIMKMSFVRSAKYGAVIEKDDYSPEIKTWMAMGKTRLNLCIAHGILDAPEYNSIGQIGSKLSYDIYDATKDSVLVQRRYTTFNSRKNFQHVHKTYWVISGDPSQISEQPQTIEISDTESLKVTMRWSKVCFKPGQLMTQVLAYEAKRQTVIAE
jgi:hypothetical protein